MQYGPPRLDTSMMSPHEAHYKDNYYMPRYKGECIPQREAIRQHRPNPNPIPNPIPNPNPSPMSPSLTLVPHQ